MNKVTEHKDQQGKRETVKRKRITREERLTMDVESFRQMEDNYHQMVRFLKEEDNQ